MNEHTHITSLSEILHLFHDKNQKDAKFRLIEDYVEMNFVEKEKKNDFIIDLLAEGFRQNVMQLNTIEKQEQQERQEKEEEKEQKKIDARNEKLKIKKSERKQQIQKGKQFMETAEGMEGYAELKNDPIFGWNLHERAYTYGHEAFHRMKNEVNFVELAKKLHSERHLLLAKVLVLGVQNYLDTHLDENKKSFHDKFLINPIRSSKMSKITKEIKDNLQLQSSYSFTYGHYFRIYHYYYSKDDEDDEDDEYDEYESVYQNGICFIDKNCDLDFHRLPEIIHFLTTNHFIQPK